MTSKRLTPLRVLVVEDDPDDAELAILSLRKGDYEIAAWLQVQSVAGMRAAMQREPFDLIVSDVVIPGYDVSEALVEARRIKPDLPFIVMSGAIGEAGAVALLREGATEYVPKSNLARLPEAVRRARGSGQGAPAVAPSQTAPSGEGPEKSPGPERPFRKSSPWGSVPRPIGRMLGDAVLLAVVYGALAEGIAALVKFGNTPEGVASFWPAAGVTVVALMRSHRRGWWLLLAGIGVAEFSVDMANHFPATVSLGFGLANMVEPLLSVLLLRRFVVGKPDLSRRSDLFKFIACAVDAGPLLGALVGATTIAATGSGTWHVTFFRWWIGDGIGVLVIAPALLVSIESWRVVRSKSTAPAVLFFVGWTLFTLGPWGWTREGLLTYMAVPALVLMALVGSHVHAVFSVVFISVVVDAVTALDIGPFGHAGAFHGLVTAQAFIGMCAFTALIVSALSEDLVARDRVEAVLRSTATHDSLTGLANRQLMSERLEIVERTYGVKTALLFVDIDDFKSVNDMFGHAAGDALLIETASRLKSVVRDKDTIARLGGDEFLVLLENVSSVQEARLTAARLNAALSRPFLWGETAIATRASIGVAVTERASADIEALLVEADRDMYRIKASARLHPRSAHGR